MHDVTHRPGTIVEERGEGWFRPARPVPFQQRGGAFASLLAMRRNLISVFSEADYACGNSATRLFGRQIVILNDPDSIKHVMVTNNDNFERKSPQMRRALEHLVGDGLFISDGETWQRRRPLVADIVHRNRLPHFARSMEAAASDMVSRWEMKPAESVFDVLGEMAELTAEIIAQTVFGQRLGSAAARSVVEGFTRYQRLIDSVNIGYFFGADEGWPVFRGLRLRRSIRQIHKVIDDIVARHVANSGDDNSMVELLVRRQARSPELGLDLGALCSEAATMFMAGHETTAATLTWAWYLLSNAPGVGRGLQGERGGVVGSRRPAVADVANLNWCRAVVEETLRLYPPVPLLPRQAANADRVAGIDIEPAALVVVAPWLLHRATDLWDRPADFLPERFLGTQRPPPYTYIPFAAGPRVCPGMSFGLTEAILCLATLAQRFKVRVAEGHRVEPHCRLSLRPRGGLPVHLERRG